MARLGRHPDIVERLAIICAGTPLGNRHPAEIAGAGFVGKPPGPAQMAIAARAWSAFLQATLERWANLLNLDLGSLPILRPLVLRMLQELPDSTTGLSTSETDILAFIGNNEVNVLDVLRYGAGGRFRVLDYWAFGRTLDVLARQEAPAISGLQGGPFNLAMHDDDASYKRYCQSGLKLTKLGKRLVDLQDDFARTAAICRWWGGTRLSNAHLWRWNEAAHQLVAPN